MAYIRVLRGSIDPIHADKVVGAAPPIAAIIEGLPGCQGVQVGIDRATGSTTAISTWDTLEHAQWPVEVLGEAVAPLVAIGWKRESSEIYEQVT